MNRIALLVAAFLAFAPLRVAGQPIVTTVVGGPEVIAVAVDHGSGTTYFATDRPGAIYRIPLNGSPALLAGVAGGRTDDGAPAAQSAVFPGRNGLAIDASGNVYFSEPSLHRIRQIDGSGTVTTIAGTGLANQIDPSNIFGNLSINTDLPAPTALAVNPVTGDLFAADETWDIVVQITANGAALSPSTARTFLAIGGDPNSAAIFLDFFWYNAFGYSGDGGPAIDAKLNHPRGLSFDALGNLYIADTGNHVVRRVDTNGTITTFAGNGTPGFAGDGGAATNARLFMPTGVLATAAGDLVIADTSNHRVRFVDSHSGAISTIAGTGVAGHSGDSAAAIAASLAYPLGIAESAGGSLLIVDSQNNRLRSVSQSLISTLAQTGADYSGNGAPGGNAVNQPLAVVFDKNGNLFFTDTGNARVRRVDATTHTVTTVVGSGVPGYSGDNGPAVAAMLNCPTALTFDKNGVLFVADGCANTVRRVVPGVDGLVTGAADEIITTYAGTGARYGASDGEGGPAASARLANPVGLAIDSTGTLYIGELDAFDVRTVDPSGIISFGEGSLVPTGLVIDPKYDALIVSNQEESDLECGGSQIFQQGDLGLPVGAGGSALDALSRLYLSDDRSLQSVYRLTNSAGGDICDASFSTIQVSFVAGTGHGVAGYSGDGGLATAATFNSPEGVAIDPAGNLVIADSGNNVIRRVQQPSISVNVDVSSVDFGIQGLLATSPSSVITATSTGSTAATFTATTLSGANPADFIITSDGCAGAVVAVGATCQVRVSFRPTALGTRTATLQINDNASGAPQLVSLTGVGASLTVAPLTISFPSQTVGIASAPTTVIVTNGTATTTTVLSLLFSGTNANDFAIASSGCAGAVLTSQASCTFNVTFAPQDVGPRTATLNVSSTAADSPQSISLSGTGIPAFPAVQLAPGSIAFPTTTVGSTSTNTTVTVNSTGTAPLSLTSLTLTGNQPGDFKIAGGTCAASLSLSPGQSCTALIAFAPQAACNSSASLSIVDNVPGSPQTIALTGFGVNPVGGPFTTALFCTSHAAQPHELAAAPDGRVWFDEGGSAFAPPALANVSTSQGVKENPGAIDSPDKLAGLAFTPDGSHAYFESEINVGNWISLVNPAGVKLKSPTQFPFSVIAGPDYGFWEAHDFSCGDFSLATDFAPTGKTSDFTPTSAWIYANASQHSCVSTSSMAPGPDGTVWFGITADGGGVNAGHAASPNGFIRVAPDGTFVDFTADQQTTGTTLSSDGNFYALFQTIGACNIERIDATGKRTTITIDPNLASPDCQTIVAGPDKRLWMVGRNGFAAGFVNALIALDPATGAISTYPAPATLYLTVGPDEGIWFDALPSAVGRLDIGGGPSRGFLTPQSLSFQGPTGGATSAAKTVTLYSTGTAPLVVSSVSIGGTEASEFFIQDDCGGHSVAPGSSCTVVVASRSTKPGNHLATLVINDNDAFSPQTVPLAEFTDPPSPSVTPLSVSFPTTNVGQQSTPVKLTLLNPMDRPLAVNFVSIDGTNGTDFKKITDTCSTTSVPAGGTCTVTISFAPTTTGTRTAIVTFNDAANPPTQTVPLTGGGNTPSGGGGTTSGTCACSKTGLFVDPTVVTPANTMKSPNGLFTLTVTPPANGNPTVLTITSATQTVATFSVADAAFPVTPSNASPENVGWGFSPDGNGFAVHFESTSTQSDEIWLYDLTVPSNNPVWKSDSIPLNPAPGGTAIGPAGSIAFSPHGNYLIATQLQTNSATSEQHVFLAVVSSKGVRVWSDDWSPSAAGGGSDASGGADTKAGSAFWGFSPDDRSFTFVKRLQDGTSTLTLANLSTQMSVQALPFNPASLLATYVQFSPCGDVLAVLEQQTASTLAFPVSVTLYQTAAPAPAIVSRSSLPTGTATLTAGPTNFTISFVDWTGDPNLAPNTAAAGCAPPTTTGNAGGSAPLQAPVFDPTTQTPANLVVGGQAYSFTFSATGTPAPTFALNSADVLPVWVSIDPNSGELIVAPPLDVTLEAITFSVQATNPGDVSKFALLGPFTINVTPPSPPPPPANDGGSGPYSPDADPAAFEPAAPLAAPAAFEQTQGGSPAPPASTVLLLPNGRGQIQLPQDVTPSLSTFTYTEVDTPGAPVGPLVFLGLDFTLNAVDAVSGAAVRSLTDSPFATIALQDSDLKSARIRDFSTLGLYWWSGTTWVNQFPCAGCVVDANARTLSVSLQHLGEYMLAAVLPPVPVLTITPAAIHATAGVSLTTAVASFVPASPLDTLSQYAALIAWGDGQVSAGALGSSGTGTFIVSGTHTWMASGNYPVTVTVFSGSASWIGQATAVVAPVSSPPQFTAAAPPLTATAGATYSYTFAASGVPAPTFALASGAPSWLSIGATSGVVAGTPPSGTTSFAYGVVASNGVSPNATAGPFTVTVATTTKTSADVAVTISGPATATKGSTVTYTVVLANNGPSSATNALVVVGVGPNASLVSATPNPQVNLPGLWTWSVPALASAHSTTFTLKVKVTKAGTVVAATAAGSETHDPKLGNNVAAVETIVR